MQHQRPTISFCESAVFGVVALKLGEKGLDLAGLAAIVAASAAFLNGLAGGLRAAAKVIEAWRARPPAPAPPPPETRP